MDNSDSELVDRPMLSITLENLNKDINKTTNEFDIIRKTQGNWTKNLNTNS